MTLLPAEYPMHSFGSDSSSKYDVMNSYFKLRKVRFALKVAITVVLCGAVFLAFTPMSSDKIDVYSSDYVTPPELYPELAVQPELDYGGIVPTDGERTEPPVIPNTTPNILPYPEHEDDSAASDAEGNVDGVFGEGATHADTDSKHIDAGHETSEHVDSGHAGSDLEVDPNRGFDTVPHDGAVDDAPHSKVVKTVFHDKKAGYEKVIYRNSLIENDGDAPTVLFMSSIGSENAFGPDRHFADFLITIKSMEYDPKLISLGLLCGTELVYHETRQFFDDMKDDDFEFARVTLVRETFVKESFGRHDDRNEVQRIRRRLIARWRNFALLSSLVDERYTLFFDADVFRIDHPDMLERFVRLDHDVAVPIVGRPGATNDYDKNSWAGPRTKPSEHQFELFNEGKWDEAAYVPYDKNGMRHLSNMAEDIHNLPDDSPMRELDYSEPLDSVGGAVLFFKSLLFKQGVIFPPLYIVGTSWDRDEGYDGIETEGLCYMAKLMDYKCWAMPNLVAQHVP